MKLLIKNILQTIIETSLIPKKVLYKILPKSFTALIIGANENIIRSIKYGDLSNKSYILKQTNSSISCQIHPNELELLKQLSDSYLISKKKQNTASEIYEPGPEWKKILELEWQRYRKSIENGEITKLSNLLRNFFRNEAISGIWGGTNMFENFCKADNHWNLKNSNTMFDHYLVWRDSFFDVPLSQLEFPKIGNPWGYLIEGVSLYEPVFEYYYHASYFSKLLSNIEHPVVVEIGGGFGGLAYYMRKLIPSIKYIGFDLPENILLQTYYLATAYPEARILKYDSNFNKLDKALLNSYDIILLPNYELPYIESSLADLVVNIRSFSEMPINTLKEYFKEIDRISCLFIFHENINKPRLDGAYGVPSSSFPTLNNFQLIAYNESRWPKYQKNSVYPCQENLFIHKQAIFPIK